MANGIDADSTPNPHVSATNMIQVVRPVQQERDSCVGDSGGPLVFESDGKQALAGVVSFGAKECNGNSQNANVYEHKAFIEGAMNNDVATASSRQQLYERPERCAKANILFDWGTLTINGKAKPHNRCEKTVEMTFETHHGAQQLLLAPGDKITLIANGPIRRTRVRYKD